MTGLEQADDATLEMLCVRMKTSIREFVTGVRDIDAPYGRSCFYMNALFLRTIERECVSRGLDHRLFGGDVSMLVDMSGVLA